MILPSHLPNEFFNVSVSENCCEALQVSSLLSFHTQLNYSKTGPLSVIPLETLNLLNTIRSKNRMKIILQLEEMLCWEIFNYQRKCKVNKIDLRY